MDYLDEIRRYNSQQGAPTAGRTALLVLDMQRYFRDVWHPILENVLTLIDACRSSGIKIAFTRHGHRDPKVDGGMLAQWWTDLIEYGTDEWELLDELLPKADEPVMDIRPDTALSTVPTTITGSNRIASKM